MKIFFSCAAIQMPSGGPKDEIPPQLVYSSPENGAPFFKGGKVEIAFSEHLDQKSVYQYIYDSSAVGRRLYVRSPDK